MGALSHTHTMDTSPSLLLTDTSPPSPCLLLTDYLVVGAGAMGMSFLEELITGSPDIEAIILDTRAQPGGRWNDAYDFVRLHQPASTYGQNSRMLGCGGADRAS